MAFSATPASAAKERSACHLSTRPAVISKYQPGVFCERTNTELIAPASSPSASFCSNARGSKSPKQPATNASSPTTRSGAVSG